MKTFGKFLLVIAVLAFFSTSCDKEGKFCPYKKVKRITYSTIVNGLEINSYYEEFVWKTNGTVGQVDRYAGANLMSTTEYTYDSHKRLAEVDYAGDWHLSYVYDGKLLDKIEVRVWDDTPGDEMNPNGQWRAFSTITVLHAGKHISELQISNAVPFIEKEKVPVDAIASALVFLPEDISKSVAASTLQEAKKDGPIVHRFTWDGDNISTHEIIGDEEITYTYEYDDALNPLYGFFAYSGLEYFDVCLSKNNVLKITSPNMGQDAAKVPYPVLPMEYTYEYDGKYPVSRTNTVSVDGFDFATRITYEY